MAAEASKTPTKPEPVTATECEALAKRMTEKFNAGRTVGIFEEMDQRIFVDRALRGFEIGADQKRSFEEEFLGGLIERMVGSLNEFDSAKMIRITVDDGVSRVLMRFSDKEQGLAYLLFTVCKSADGEIRWADVYSYYLAESICESSRRFLMALTKGRLSDPRNALEASVLSNGQFHLERIDRIEAFFAKKEYDRALRAIDKLPDELRTSKNILAMRLRAAQEVSEEEQLKAIEAWEDAHPGDASLHLIAIDGHIVLKKYDEAVRCVDALTKELKGTDGKLCAIKAYLLDAARSRSAAKSAAEEGVRVEPEYEENYIALLKFAIESQEYSDAVRILKQIEQNLPDKNPNLLLPASEFTKDFCRSSEYRAWARKRME